MSNTAQAPSRAAASQKSVDNTVNVIAIIDTDLIKKNNSRNSGPDAAVAIGHDGITMLCAAKNFVGDIDNDPANLEFSGNVGDFISFWATSISNNADDAVIIYDITSITTGVNVFNAFQANQETRTGAVIPDTSKQDGLPALSVPKTFYSLDSKIKGNGTEAFKVSFALYELDATREKQTLYGCYNWDPTIVVQ